MKKFVFLVVFGLFGFAVAQAQEALEVKKHDCGSKIEMSVKKETDQSSAVNAENKADCLAKKEYKANAECKGHSKGKANAECKGHSEGKANTECKGHSKGKANADCKVGGSGAKKECKNSSCKTKKSKKEKKSKKK